MKTKCRDASLKGFTKERGDVPMVTPEWEEVNEYRIILTPKEYDELKTKYHLVRGFK